MISRRANRKTVNLRRAIGATVFFVALILVLGLTGAVGALSGVATGIAKPFFATGRAIGSGAENIGTLFLNKKALTREAEELRTLVVALEADLLHARSIEKENEQLKASLSRMPDDEVFILGRVLLKPHFSPYDTLIIDIGERESVAVGDQVFAEGSVYIGNVQEVYARTAKVLLLSAPEEKTIARLSGSGIDVELVGHGGGSFEVALSRDVAVVEGEAVVIPSLFSSLVGRVVRSVTDPRDPTQTVFIQSPVNIQTLDFVEVRKVNE